MIFIVPGKTAFFLETSPSVNLISLAAQIVNVQIQQPLDNNQNL